MGNSTSPLSTGICHSTLVQFCESYSCKNTFYKHFTNANLLQIWKFFIVKNYGCFKNVCWSELEIAPVYHPISSKENDHVLPDQLLSVKEPCCLQRTISWVYSQTMKYYAHKSFYMKISTYTHQDAHTHQDARYDSYLQDHLLPNIQVGN